MLDLAAEVQANSRLGCQIRLTAALDGLTVRVPRTHAAGLAVSLDLGLDAAGRQPRRRRHVGRGRQLGRGGAAGRGRLRGGRRHAPALRPRRGHRPQGRLLRRRATSTTPAPSPTRLGIAALRPRLRGPLQGGGDRRFRRQPTPRAARRSPACAATSGSSSRDLLEIARDLGAAALATGHYVRRVAGPGRPGAAPRRRPGQGPELLPVRHHARAAGVPALPAGRPRQGRRPAPTRSGWASRVADKPDSQDICFVPNGHYSDVVARLRPDAFAAGRDRPCRRPRARPPRGHRRASPSASGAACASPTASASTSSASSRERRRVVVGPRQAG